MPYIDKTPIQSVEEALDLWKGVMHDPNIDGYNGFACKQKIYKTLWAAKKALEGAPEYYGEEEWIQKENPFLKQSAGESLQLPLPGLSDTPLPDHLG